MSDDVKGMCSPLSNNTFTCYNNDTLMTLRDAWDKRHPDDKITDTSPIKIWEHFKDRFNNVCSKEKCWIRSIFPNGNSKLEKELFVPDRPTSWNKNPNEWLTSVDIERVMKQYEKKYKSFAFLGAVPIDFAEESKNGTCVVDDLCMFNIKKYLSRGKNKFGLVINTDPHTKDGEHWFSIFIDVSNSKCNIYLFDSGGGSPPMKIKEFVKNIEKQLKPLNIPCLFDYNKKRHQYTTYECGMYGIYFVTQMLTGKLTMDDVHNGRISDDLMSKMRYHFFG